MIDTDTLDEIHEQLDELHNDIWEEGSRALQAAAVEWDDKYRERVNSYEFNKAFIWDVAFEIKVFGDNPIDWPAVDLARRVPYRKLLLRSTMCQSL